MKKIEKFINEHKKLFLIGKPPSDEIILKAEKKLGFKFDNDYYTFVKNFGFIAYGPIEIMGLGAKANSHLDAVNSTLELKNTINNFPENSIVLEYIGEGNYAIYTMNSGVYQYSRNNLVLLDSTLENYLLMRFEEV